MGLVFLLIGLLITGVIVDFAIENDVVGSPERTFELFGGTFTLGETQLVLAAAVIGALAVAFVLLGLAMARGSHDRRRTLRRRVRTLERENQGLRASSSVVTPDTPDRVDVREDERERHEALG
jgi:uncharacterized integral membrane protein